MIKLIKYEILKSKTAIIVFFVVSALIEVVFLLGNYLYTNVDSKSDYINGIIQVMYFLGIVGYACMLPISAIMVLIFAVSALTSDIGKKQGYTVFLTPNSAKMIVGSKLIVSLIAAVVIVLFFIVFSMLNFSILFEQYDENGGLAGIAFSLLKEAFAEGYGFTIVLGIFSGASQWIGNIALIYFAVTLTYTMLNNTKGKGFIAFIFYMILSGIVSAIASIPTAIVSGYFEASKMSVENIYNAIFPLSIVINLLMAAGFFFGTSSLIEKKLSM